MINFYQINDSVVIRVKNKKPFDNAIKKYNKEVVKLEASCFPKTLYKYMSFNDYTVEMIRDNYLYLSPAKLMDDQFDCSLNFDADYYLNHNENEIMHFFLEWLKKYAKQKADPKVKKHIDSMFNLYYYDGTIKEDKAKHFLLNKVKGINPSKIDEFLKLLNEKKDELFSNNVFISGCENILESLIKQKENTGLCSMTETNMSQIMWQMYSNRYEGLCIEYDVATYLKEYMSDDEVILPVIYKKRKDFNPIKMEIKLILDLIIFPNDKIKIQREFFEDYFKILSTKNAEWSFQKEWRIIGKPCTKLTIPKIKKIYLGKNIKSENKDFILSLANELDFEVYMQEDDYENLTFRYVKIRG